MGGRYLTDLADVCRRTGYPVVEVDGWPYRARGSGGYDPGRPDHVMIHHTASGPDSDGWPDVDYCTFGDDDAPLCNLYLARDGTIYVCAGGATNTNGSGHDPCGDVADDSMNTAAIGIEAGNDGVGETWPPAQLDCYLALCRELGAAYAIASGRIHAHWEWAPSRKSDPAGPPRPTVDGHRWDMAAFRADVDQAAAPTPSPPEPEPEPEEGDDMLLQFLGAVDRPGPAVAAAPGFFQPVDQEQYDALVAGGFARNEINWINARQLDVLGELLQRE
jgi:N-acetylmuramoyl-L-alanine amidase